MNGVDRRTERAGWRIEISRACLRSGICAASAPRHFTVGADHRTRPVEGPVEPDPVLLDLVEACPAGAISLTHQDTGRAVTARPEETTDERGK
ncbi:ferredoxin [Streptomyces scopuliridis]|uniref:ferredoxin n=1 Tax=Streptomyces scopuliridis TaxID=452529 RepID=UPI0036CA736C